MPFNLGNIDVGLSAGDAASSGEVGPQTPFRILLLGNFSGHAARDVPPAQRKPLPIDRDNFEQVLARLNVTLRLSVQNSPPMTLRFADLDDFQPDRLWQQAELFEQLRDLRTRLSDPRTAAQAAAGLAAPAAPAAPATPAGPSGFTLEEMFGSGPPTPEPEAPPPSDWQAFLSRVVQPHLVDDPDPRQVALLGQVEGALGAQLRALLHHPDFQALEAAWRGAYFLVRRLETDGGLRLFLLDISRDELAADLVGADDLRRTAAHQLLVEQTVGTPGAVPWALLLGQYRFGPDLGDVELLARLGLLARLAGALFVAAAADGVLGCASLAATPDPRDWPLPGEQEQAAWALLRQLPGAPYLALALPRFLLRLPYGRDTSPVEAFPFEEMPEGQRAHEDYLWGNGAVLVAYGLGAAFLRHGWALDPDDLGDVEGLPLHAVTDGGDAEVQPCAEVLPRDRTVAAWGERGLTALLSLPGRDVVRLGRLRSLADPSRKLAGRWDSTTLSL